MTETKGVSAEEFVMPPVHHGQVVAWYPTGARSDKPQAAIVSHVGVRTLVLLTAVAGVKESVRHIDDPKTMWNFDQRANGAWDYTEFFKAEAVVRQREAAEREHILDRLAVIEAKIGITEADVARVETYNQLRERAIKLGIQVSGRPPRAWLEEQIATLQATKEQSV